LALVIGDQGPITSAKNAQTYPTYDMSPTQKKIQNFLIFYNPN